MTIDTTTDEDWWVKQGYLAGKPLDEGLWICLADMMFTYRLMVCDPTPSGVHEFYCYPKERGIVAALSAFFTWEGEGDPPDGWVKHHPSGRRRHP